MEIYVVGAKYPIINLDQTPELKLLSQTLNKGSFLYSVKSTVLFPLFHIIIHDGGKLCDLIASSCCLRI